MKFYGSVVNRMEENRDYTKGNIEVGTFATQYLWSDRHAYEVIEVINQSHLILRRLTAIRTDKNYQSECQEYRFESNKNGATMEIKRRKNGGWNLIRRYEQDGKQHARAVEKVSISFGVADEYYDYSF